MKVLIACEFSGVVRDAFLLRGHSAISCDLLPTDRPGPHIWGDVRKQLSRSWDLIIAHPPCTYLCNSGVRWLYEKEGRWRDMRAGAQFFCEMLDANAPRIAVENPIMHGYAKKIIGREPSQLIQPWQFGHGETKATCLWLKGLPLLIPTRIVDGRAPRVHIEAPSKDRWRKRSITLQGVADAMAAQWG